MLGKYALRIFFIYFITRTAESDQVVLVCDEYADFCLHSVEYTYCTITGLHVAHSQQVAVSKPSCKGVEDSVFMKFYDSELLYIPQAIFVEFPRLQNLDVSNSGIIEISRNTFTMAYDLIWLDVSSNNIRAITGSVFLGASNLRDLHLNHNHIELLNEHSFNGLKSLLSLNLASNQIVNVERNIFSENSLLEKIDLSDNRIDHIEIDVFRNLNSLKLVDLAKNKLVNIDSKIFQNSNDLRSVYISDNFLQHLTLTVRENLTKLDAGHNELSSFSINCTEHVNNLPCESLESLDLSFNKIKSLKNITNLANLKQLILGHNNIGKLNISTFAKLKKLKKLDLSHTNVNGLTFGTFSSQTHLEYLDLSGNNLKYLNVDIFLPYMYQHLQELHLSGNNLSEINGRHTFASFSSLQTLGLDGNQFNCSYLLHLMSLLNQGVVFPTANVSSERENVHGIECLHNQSASSGLRDAEVQESSLVRKNDIRESTLYEKHLEQNLLFMKSLVIIIAVLGISGVIYKVTKLWAQNRSSWVNTISYRSTNIIQSDLDLP